MIDSMFLYHTFHEVTVFHKCKKITFVMNYLNIQQDSIYLFMLILA